MKGCFCCDTIDEVEIRNQTRRESRIVDVQKSLRVVNSDIAKDKQSKQPSDAQKGFYDYKDTLMCLFCGGKRCKHEDYLKHSNPAIIGLNSDQIDQNIFASQRPSNTLINDFHLIEQFKEKNIGLIINVQRPGEHPYCGPNGGLDPESGFTYTPSLFNSEDIKVKLFGWKDMNVPDSLTFMLDIVKEIHLAINALRKKVLVHCHAGYGRTGIVIACYKIFSENLTSEDAIKEIRTVRSKCVQNSSQQQYCLTFFKFISQMKEVFKQSKGDIKLFIQYQNSLSIDNSTIPFVPKMITEAFEAINRLKKINAIGVRTIYQALNGSLPFSDQMDSCLQVIINSINRGNWESLFRCGDIVLIAELLFVWFDESVKCCINPNRINNLFKDDVIKTTNALNAPNPNEAIDEVEVKAIVKIIQKHLRKYEYETLIYIADFIQSLKRDNKDEDVNKKEGNDENKNEEEERHMIEKLSTFSLGYNIKFLYDDTTKSQEYYSSIHKMSCLIQYLSQINGVFESKEMIKKASTVFQNINHPSNKRSQLLQSIEMTNKQIDEVQEEDLFNCYLLLQDHFNNQSSSINYNSNNSHKRHLAGSKMVRFDNQPISESNHIVRDYTMKNEAFKSKPITITSSIAISPNLNSNANGNSNDNDNQSYRNKFRSTKQLKISQVNENRTNSFNTGMPSKKLWIKEEDC